MNRPLVLVGLVIDGQSEGHGVTPIDLSTDSGQPQTYYIKTKPPAKKDQLNQMRHAIGLSSCRLSLDHDPIRLPSRRYTLRRPDYEDQFDFTTLYNDIFWSRNNTKIILVGPPHLNLGVDVPIRYIALPSQQECTPTHYRLQWTDRIEITPPPNTTGLLITCGESGFYTTPQPYLGHLFAGKRALFTMNKNNNLEWIHDWALFYSQNHGCDAVVFYDNNSDRYSVNDIHTALATAIPHAEVAVIDWPFRYGVFDGRKGFTIGLWDSFFSQNTIFEHARHRFLGQAEAVVNADIDELILCDEDASLFELTKTSQTGYLCFSGQWVSAHTTTEKKQRSFRDFHFLTAQGAEMTETKWAVDPCRCPEQAQWTVHRVLGMHEDRSSLQSRIRHFKGINTNWDVDTFLSRSLRTHTQDIEREELLCDEHLKQVLEHTFPAQSTTLAHPSRSITIRAHALRVKAGRFERGQRLHRAVQLARQACQLLPEHPGFKFYLARLLKTLNRVDEASTVEQEAETILDQDAAHHAQTGRMHLGQLDFARAKTRLTRAIELNPLIIDTYESLAEIHESNGDDDLSSSLISTAPFPAEPVDVLSAARLSLLCERIADQAGAVRYIQAMLRMVPSAYGHYRLGKLLSQAGNHEAALAALSQAIIELNSGMKLQWTQQTSEFCLQQVIWDIDICDITSELGTVLLKLGRYFEAEEQFSAVVAIAPMFLQAYSGLAKALALTGDAQSAGVVNNTYLLLTNQRFLYDNPNGRNGIFRMTVPLWQKRHFIHLSLERIQALIERDERMEASKQVLALVDELEQLPNVKLIATNLFLQMGELSQAEQCLERFIQQRDISWAAFGLLAQIDFIKGNDESGLSLIDTALNRNPTAIFLHARRSKTLADAGRHDEALLAIQRGMEISPNLPELQFQLCNLHLTRGDLQAAHAAAERALALDASHPESHAFLSRVQLALGHAEEAVKSALNVLAIEPYQAIRHLQLSKAQKASGNLAEAITAAAKAVELEPTNPDFQLYRVELAIEAGDTPQALSLAHAGAKAHPHRAEFLVQIARVEIRRNNHPSAEKLARRATRLDPHNSAAYLYLGRAIQKAGRRDEAMSALEQACRLPAPDNVHATSHLWLGQLHLEAGDAKRAMQEARRAVALNPALADIHHLRSQCLVKLGKTQHSLVASERALSLNPTVLAWHLHRSNLHLKLAQHSQALQAARAAMALHPDNPLVQQQMTHVSTLPALLQKTGHGHAE